MKNSINLPELDDFINSWTQSSLEMKKAFLILKDFLFEKKDVEFEFTARPGVSFSLRPKHINQKERNLFAMVDVIDDDPDEKWLSVCFYGDMITDPEEMGGLIPGGLAGSDGYCFDVYEYDEDTVNYLKTRIDEAFTKASE